MLIITRIFLIKKNYTKKNKINALQFYNKKNLKIFVFYFIINGNKYRRGIKNLSLNSEKIEIDPSIIQKYVYINKGEREELFFYLEKSGNIYFYKIKRSSKDFQNRERS